MEDGKFSRVKVKSLLSVVSSKPIGPGKVHKLSFLDQAMGLHKVQIVFYYGSNPFINGPMQDQLDNLRVSLSYLLNEYPSATGRLTRDPEDGGWQIKCNDAGVRMLRATVNTTLDEWLRSADATEEQDLMVWEDMPEDPSFWSPFRIQINNFECGGLAIGLSCTHMHADITAATLLIKSWADVHSGQPPAHPPILQLPTPPSLPTSKDNSIAPFSAPNYVIPHSKMGTVTMRFSNSSIEKCLSQVQKQNPNATPFDLLVALFWSRIATWQEPEPALDDRKEYSLSICIDSRNLGEQPIPYGYFGNAIQFSVLSVDANSLMSGGVDKLSNRIHQHVEGLKGEDFWSVMDGLKMNRKGDTDGAFPMYGPRLTCISTEHMAKSENGLGLMYDAIFNKGVKPVHVSYNVGNVDGQGLIIVTPSPEPGIGRTVTVTLPEEQIVNLCKDPSILELEPTTILSRRR